MSRQCVVGVVGSDDPLAATAADQLGQLIAQEGWVVVSGGRDSGVMKAVNDGASRMGGLTIGILPDKASRIAPGVKVAIITDMNNARNNIIGLSSNVLVACGVDGAGTASEVALALKNGKHVILLGANQSSISFFRGLSNNVYPAATPAGAIAEIKNRKLC
jgi:uncharacterized protein (TIGR00725 family)